MDLAVYKLCSMLVSRNSEKSGIKSGAFYGFFSYDKIYIKYDIF